MNEDEAVAGYSGVNDQYYQSYYDQNIDVMEGYEEPPCEESSSTSNPFDDSEDDTRKRPERKEMVIGKHIKVTKKNPATYICLICKREFKWKNQIRYHDYCATGKRPLKCHLCNKRFVKNSHLEYHLKTHTGERPYKCSICSKSFKQKDKVKRHELIHAAKSDKEEFKCGTCNKVLSCKQSLDNHSLTHQKKSLVCEICKKHFSNPSYYKQHVKSHSILSKYVCDHCGAIFKKKYDLNNHLGSHEGVKKAQCKLCLKRFRSKQGLERHMVVHSDEADFECLFCNTTFGRKDNMARHVKNNHPMEKHGIAKCMKYRKNRKKRRAKPPVIREPEVFYESQPHTSTSVIKHTSSVIVEPPNRESVIKVLGETQKRN